MACPAFCAATSLSEQAPSAAAWIEDGNRTFTYSRNDESSSLVPGQAERWAKNSNLGLRFPCKPPREFAAVTRSLPRGRWDGTVTRRTGTLGTAICDHQRKELVPTVDLAAFVSRVALWRRPVPAS